MKNNRNIPIVILLYFVNILISAVLRSVFLFAIPVGIFGTAYILKPYPGTPDIKYAEIPFEISYEISGTKTVYSDVVVCTYEGWKVVNDTEKISVWSEKLKSNNPLAVIADFEDIKVCTEYGTALDYIKENETDIPNFDFELFTYNEKTGIKKYLSEDEACELFGIKNITFYTEPIVVDYYRSLDDMLETKIK